MTEKVVLHPQSSKAEILDLLHSLDDPKVRAVNERHGNDFGVKMADLRAMAKELKRNESLGWELWEAGSTAAQLLAVLLFRPSSCTVEQIDQLFRSARSPRVREWVTNYITTKNKHLEDLKQRWIHDNDPYVRGAGWELTAHQVVKSPELLELEKLLDEIQSKMGHEDEPVQWAMNNTLAHIGIEFEQYRGRAISIGEDLGVFQDYPTSPGCTSPYAPIWINEMVKRKSGQ